MTILDEYEKKFHKVAKRMTGAERVKRWPKYNKEAHEAAEKADPGWMNADRVTRTLGHKVYKKHR